MISGGVYELRGWATVAIDGRYVESKADLLDVLAEELRFPEWFGRNWDALQDCLTDMSWWRAEGYLVMWRHADVLAAADPEAFAVADEVFRAAAVVWADRGTPFVVLVSA